MRIYFCESSIVLWAGFHFVNASELHVWKGLISEWVFTSGTNSSVQICHTWWSSSEHCPDFSFAACLKRNITHLSQHLLRISSITVKRKTQWNRRQQLLLAGDSTGYHIILEGFFEAALEKSCFPKSLWRLRHPTWETVAFLLFFHASLEPQAGCGLQRVPKRIGRAEAVRISAGFY